MSPQHVMLSYEWTVQPLVLRVHDYLIEKGVSLWMDIKIGISPQNLYDELSAAVENAACLVCFMTPEFRNSDLCKQELQYAKQRNVPIIPVKLVGRWDPSGWLGFITAGLVWLDFYPIERFEQKAEKLYNRIRSVAGDQLHSRATQHEPSSSFLWRTDSSVRHAAEPDVEEYDSDFEDSSESGNQWQDSTLPASPQHFNDLERLRRTMNGRNGPDQYRSSSSTLNIDSDELSQRSSSTDHNETRHYVSKF